MQPGQPIYRAVHWLAQGDNGFYLALWAACPALLAITCGGFF